MIKTSAAALLLSTALMTGAVVAQTAGTAGAGASGSSQFLTQQEQSQFRASKFVGLAIYGQDNQRIGDVNEILIDNTGNAKALVLGVGGFLGIGEKNVAVPFSAVEWVNERPATTAAAGGGNAGQNTGAGGMNTAMNTSPPAGGSTSAGMGTAGTTGATGTSGGGMGSAGTSAGAGGARDASATGSAGAGAGGAAGAAQNRSPAETAAANGAPDHGKVRMTKADLQNAPEFKYFGQAQASQKSGSDTGGGAAGGGTAPKQ